MKKAVALGLLTLGITTTLNGSNLNGIDPRLIQTNAWVELTMQEIKADIERNGENLRLLRESSRNKWVEIKNEKITL